MKIWLLFSSVLALATSVAAESYDNCCYYCSNDGAIYAQAMGGISCPEGAGNTPTCPNGEDCVCTDVDGSCTDGDDDWSYKGDGTCLSGVGSSPCDGNFHTSTFQGRSCSANGVCSADDNYYDGTCGVPYQKNDERWCIHPIIEKEICCASTSDDCCVLDEGLIAGVAVGVILAISLCCTACCYCCKCCCFKYRQNQNPPAVMHVPQPGVQMQQMSYPPQQGYTPGQVIVAAPTQPTPQIQFADGTTLTHEQIQAKD